MKFWFSADHSNRFPEMEIESIFEGVTGKLDQAADSVALMLPDEFPLHFLHSVFEGMQKQARRLQ